MVIAAEPGLYSQSVLCRAHTSEERVPCVRFGKLFRSSLFMRCECAFSEVSVCIGKNYILLEFVIAVFLAYAWYLGEIRYGVTHVCLIYVGSGHELCSPHV